MKPPYISFFHTLPILSALLLTPASAAEFYPPQLLQADGKVIQIETPGYASPCLADIDGDGKKDLLVGQFNQGKIAYYKGNGKGKFGKQKWLQADGKEVRIPGIW